MLLLRFRWSVLVLRALVWATSEPFERCERCVPYDLSEPFQDGREWRQAFIDSTSLLVRLTLNSLLYIAMYRSEFNKPVPNNNIPVGHIYSRTHFSPRWKSAPHTTEEYLPIPLLHVRVRLVPASPEQVGATSSSADELKILLMRDCQTVGVFHPTERIFAFQCLPFPLSNFFALQRMAIWLFHRFDHCNYNTAANNRILQLVNECACVCVSVKESVCVGM